MRRSVAVSCLFAAAVLVLLWTPEVNSKPIKFSNWREYLEYLESTGRKLTYNENGDNKCTHGGEVKNLCEKCSKFTKNEVVFPLCCEDQDNVRAWCKRFLDYTPANS